MNTLNVQPISWNQLSGKYVPVKRGPQWQEQKGSFPTGSAKGPEKLLISYKIDHASGAISAEIIDSESGKVIREINVKPAIFMTLQKGSFFESVI